VKTGRTQAPPQAARFRRRLLAATMLLLCALTAAAFLVVRRGIARGEAQALEREFAAVLDRLQAVRQMRRAALVERARALAGKARIHAAIEDGALDLLYPSALDELRDAVAPPRIADPAAAAGALRARFYRFLDRDGSVIPPPGGEAAAGALPPELEARLALPGVSQHVQTGYIAGARSGAGVSEVFATPILSTETGEPIAALVLGFEPPRLVSERSGLVAGIRVGDTLVIPGLDPAATAQLLALLPDDDARSGGAAAGARRFETGLDGASWLVFTQPLNPGSLYPPAHEVCLFPLAAMQARQRRAGLQIVGAGAGLLALGFLGSHRLAARFSRPVATLELESHEQRVQRRRAEAELEATSAELERAARFSADASHQLKTPVTVLRAGLEEILARGAVPTHEAEEIAALIHQTYRLSSVIEDLLLLSRVDAGHLRVAADEVDLALLIASSLDDLDASPDELGLEVTADVPPALRISGERRYVALILQNLLENARKYNLPGGRIRIAASEAAGRVHLTVGNTALRPIPPESQPHIFERFHRAAMGENIPGYGIGLNLARELARLHGGDLRLLRSDADWTEFEVSFRSYPATRPHP